MTIEKLAAMRKGGHAQQALKLLHSPVTIDTAGSIFESNDDPNIDFDEPSHCLDAFSIVCRTRGFTGILPPTAASISFEAVMLPPQAMKPMQDHLAHCGFDMTERVFYFGTSGGRDMWLLFRPTGDTGHERSGLGRGGPRGQNTPLTPDCRKAFQLYLARCIKRAGVRAAIAIWKLEYSEETEWSLEKCTNLL
jgi:hypothetical protein